MMVGVQGSQTFDDYSVFLSGMAIVLRRLGDEDKELVIFSAGPKRVSDMALEFVNVSNFKGRGIKAKVIKMPESWFKTNHLEIDMFSYFCNEKENLSSLASFLDKKDVDVQVHRYHKVNK